jgi:trehalose/maltose hydrolase-like predicted phosphorylase
MLLSLSLLAALGACIILPVESAQYPTRFSGVTWDDENWQLINSNLDQGHYQSRMSLANGYFGINVASLGPFMDFDVQVDGDNINGWPLFDRRQSFATIAGFYDSQPTTNGTNFEWLDQYGGESVISGVPHWAGLLIQAGDQLLDATTNASQISGFASTLDIKNGLMSWDYDWNPSQGVQLHISYSMFVHKLNINRAAVRLSITPSADCNVTVIDVLNGDCAVRTDLVDTGFDSQTNTIFSAVSPSGLSTATAHIYSTLSAENDPAASVQLTEGPFLGGNQSSIAQGMSVTLTVGQTFSFVKFIGAASTDAFPDSQSAARDAASEGAKLGWAALLGSHANEWATVMPKDSVDSYADPATGSLPADDNIIEMQINSVTNPFYLLQNTIGANAIAAAQNNTDVGTDSIAVGGLGSDSYAGFIFWDADVWMAPGLVVSHPDAAKQIASYRAKMFPQAQKNIDGAFVSSQNESGRFSDGGAVFPWTSSRWGNCTGTGPCFDYEYHINGDIGLNLLNYYIATGDSDYFEQQLFPVYQGIAWFFAEVLTYNASTGQYDLLNATDPDEYADNVDNPGFTMVLIQNHLETANTLRQRFGLSPNTTWSERAAKINIPVNQEAGIILEYSTMNGSISVKQADVVLVNDFLDYNSPYSLSDMRYYAGKQSQNGPGMTYGVFSIVANLIPSSGCAAYTYDLYGSQPYTRAPWFQYSEQLIDDYTANGGTHPAYPFHTAMGGANRVAVYGYLGLHLKLESLNINPNLPPPIPFIRYRTIYWQGHPISASSNATHTTLARRSGSLPNANSAFLAQPIPVTIGFNTTTLQLPPGGTLVVQNRAIGYNATVDGNIAQCKAATSPQPWVAGQIPFAAVDGGVSTKWRPALSNATASVTVDLGPEAAGIQVAGFAMDWAQHPPTSWQVDFGGADATATGGGTWQTVFGATSVDVSNPLDPSKAADITPYVGNTSSVTLPAPVAVNRFVRLSIAGNQGDSPDLGATVAEFGVIRVGGGKVVPNPFYTVLPSQAI